MQRVARPRHWRRECPDPKRFRNSGKFGVAMSKINYKRERGLMERLWAHSWEKRQQISKKRSLGGEGKGGD